MNLDLDFDSDEFRWGLVSMLVGMLASRFTFSASRAGWKFLRGTPPPLNPEQHGTSWTDALLWGVATGVAVGVMRVLVRKGAAGVWKNLGHRLPGADEEIS